MSNSLKWIAGLGLVGAVALVVRSLLKGQAAAPRATLSFAGIPFAYENYTNSAVVYVTNASTRGGLPCDYTFQVGVNITDAFGNLVTFAAFNKVPLPLGREETASVTIPIPIQPGYFGAMTAKAVLVTTDGTQFIAESTPLAINVVEESPIAGLAFGPMVIWSTTLGLWSNFVNNMNIALPGYNEFRAQWINNLTINVAGYVLVSAETPAGTKVFLTTNSGQNTVAAPGGGSWVGFVGPTIDRVGTYKYTISLYTIAGSEYTLRDRVKRNLIVT